MNRSAVRTAESLALQEEAFSNALKAQAEGFKQSLTDELTKQKTDMAAQLQVRDCQRVDNIHI